MKLHENTTAATDRTQAPPVRELPEMSLPATRKRILPNGITLTILDQGVQPVSRITLQWRTGSADVAHPAALSLLMPMLLEGTSRHSGAEIAEILEYNGAWKATETARHQTSLSVFMLNKSAETIFRLVSELVSDSVFPESTLAALCERQAAQADLRQQKVDTISRQEAMRMAYGASHPFSRIVAPDELRAVTRDDVMNMFERIVRGYPPEIYLSGQISDAMEELAARIFGNLKFDSPAAQELQPVPAAPLAKSATRRIERPDSLQTAVTIMLPVAGMSHRHPDYELLRVAVTALGGYFGSRLMSNIREEKGYTYGISAYLSSTAEGAFVTIATQTDNRHAGALLDEVWLEIGRLAQEPPTEEEMEVVRRTMASNLAGILDSPFTVMDYHRQVESLGLDHTRFAHQLKAVESATPDDIRLMAERYLIGAPRLTALAGHEA